MFETVKLRRRLHYGVGPILAMALTAMVFLSCSRLLLTLWQSEVLNDVSLSWIIMQGIRVDFASVCGLFALPLLVLLIGSFNPYVRVPRVLLFCIRIYATLAFAFLVFNELLTPWFINDFGSRPNHIYVHYLAHLGAMLSLLWEEHMLNLFITIVGTILAIWGSFYLNGFYMRSYRQGSFKYNATALVITICIVPLGIRSNFNNKPFSPELLAVSQNTIANALPLNSSYLTVYNMFHLDEMPNDLPKDIN